jgi:hypothetical protein
MRKIIIMLCAAALLVVGTTAQPEDPIVTPVSGIVLINDNGAPVLFDLTTESPIEIDLVGLQGILLDPQGQTLVAERLDPNTRNGSIVIQPLYSQSAASTILETSVVRDGSTAMGRRPVDWNAQSTQVMFLRRTTTLDAVTGALSLPSHALEILDVSSGALQTILDIPAYSKSNDYFFAAWNTYDAVLSSIQGISWNPTHPEWIFLQVLGIGKDAQGEDIGMYDAGVYNWATRQYVSFEPYFPQTVVSGAGWNADGTLLAMTTITGITVVQFGLEADGSPRIRVVADGVESEKQSIVNWLGVDDLLISGNTIPYERSFIAQVIDGKWYSQEFVAINGRIRSYFLPGQWHLTAGEAEQAALRCLFVDRAIAPRLTVGGSGQVAFTDGTPSRLRAAPNTSATVVGQMPEGTRFSVMGAPVCGMGYRWWPVQTPDGLSGWVAEGTPSEYWVGPVVGG